MKKKYEKPQIFIEKFSLCMNIAGDCERIVGNPSRYNCAVTGTGGTALFHSDMGVCDYTSSEGDTYDGFCYHVPYDDTELFNS